AAATAAAAAAAATAASTPQGFPPVCVDVSFEGQGHNGQAANRLVRGFVDQFPALRPLVLVLKQFLKDRGLCESYTGGLSSYALVLMVARYLQEQSWQMDTGSLLMGFLDFYGNHFDPRTTGISVGHRCFFSRMPSGPMPGGGGGGGGRNGGPPLAVAAATAASGAIYYPQTAAQAQTHATHAARRHSFAHGRGGPTVQAAGGNGHGGGGSG
ncbi:unnamed protein product, partial [Phaeothamnion confervicola]